MPSEQFANPYKFRLWFGRWSYGIFTARQCAMVLHFLSYGRSGCDSWNYKLAKLFGVSIRTLQYDLRTLERYQVIQIDGALGKHRKIKVFPCSNRRLFFQWAFQQMAKKQGAKFCIHQRRSYKDYKNRARHDLLYGPVSLELKGTGLTDSALTFLQKYYVEKFMKIGYNRPRAIKWASLRILRRFKKG